MKNWEKFAQSETAQVLSLLLIMGSVVFITLYNWGVITF